MDLSAFDIIEPPKHLIPYVRRYFYINQPLDEALNFEMFPSNSAYFVNFLCNQPAKIETQRSTLVSVKQVQSPVQTRWTLGGPILKGDVQVHAPHEMRMIVCEFTAGAIYQLFGINGDVLTDRRAELNALSSKIESVAKQCFLSDEMGEAQVHISEMNAFITDLSQSARPLDKAIIHGLAQLEAHDGVIKISDLVKDLDISERQFLRLFKSVIGMSPKKYGQVLQINWALKLMFLEGEDAILSNIAHDAGFSDQSHFIKVMQSIFKQSPTQFLDSSYIEIEAFLRQDSHFEAIMALIPKKSDKPKS